MASEYYKMKSDRWIPW